MHDMQINPVGFTFVVGMFGYMFFMLGLFCGTHSAYNRCEKIMGMRS